MAKDKNDDITKKKKKDKDKNGDNNTEKKAGKKDVGSRKNKGKKDLHVALPRRLIDKLKDAKDWPKDQQQCCQWTCNEEKVEELFHRQFDAGETLLRLLAEEEIVWEDNVWVFHLPTGCSEFPRAL